VSKTRPARRGAVLAAASAETGFATQPGFTLVLSFDQEAHRPCRNVAALHRATNSGRSVKLVAGDSRENVAAW
jgi:hypothetical protein